MWDEGKWGLIFALLIGLFYYFIYSKKMNYLARLVIGFFLGIAAGRGFQEFTNDYWPQIPKSFKTLLPQEKVVDAAGQTIAPAVSGADAINNLLFMVILLCVMSYFFFSIEQKNPVLKHSAKWGRWLMMFTFGAIFGSTIMGRLALFIDRMDFLLNDFGPKIGGGGVMFVILLAMSGLMVYLVSRPGARANDMGAE
jgi:preprotein translocase subunit YajC